MTARQVAAQWPLLKTVSFDSGNIYVKSGGAEQASINVDTQPGWVPIGVVGARATNEMNGMLTGFSLTSDKKVNIFAKNTANYDANVHLRCLVLYAIGGLVDAGYMP